MVFRDVLAYKYCMMLLLDPLKQDVICPDSKSFPNKLFAFPRSEVCHEPLMGAGSMCMSWFAC